MAPASWELVDHVINEFPASETKADFLEAIVVAVDHLREVVKGSWCTWCLVLRVENV